MTLLNLKKIVTTSIVVASLGVFSFSAPISSSAQVVPENFGLADWGFSASQSNAILFRSSTDLTVSLLNLRTNDIVTPATAGGEFTCRIEARRFTAPTDTAAWTTLPVTAAAPTALATSVPYTPTNATSGCSATMTKAIRGNDINWIFRVTVTRVGDATKTYVFNNTYAYLVQGFGVSSGS